MTGVTESSEYFVEMIQFCVGGNVLNTYLMWLPLYFLLLMLNKNNVRYH